MSEGWNAKGALPWGKVRWPSWMRDLGAVKTGRLGSPVGHNPSGHYPMQAPFERNGNTGKTKWCSCPSTGNIWKSSNVGKLWTTTPSSPNKCGPGWWVVRQYLEGQSFPTPALNYGLFLHPSPLYLLWLALALQGIRQSFPSVVTWPGHPTNWASDLLCARHVLCY